MLKQIVLILLRGWLPFPCGLDEVRVKPLVNGNTSRLFLSMTSKHGLICC